MGFNDMLKKVCYECKKHSPEILMGIGIGGAATGAFLIGRTSYKKLPKIVEEHKERVEKIETKEDERKDKVVTTVEVVKAYAVPVTVEVTSLVCVLASNQIMRKRAAGLAAAFTTVSTAFEKYRERVRELYGEDVERSIYLGERKEVIETTDEKGKTKKETITVADPSSKTGKFMIKGVHPDYTDDENLMAYMVQLGQANINDSLKRAPEGFITLNKCYKEFNFQGTQSGLVLGKIYRPRDLNNYITVVYKKTKVQDEDGNFLDAWWIDFEGLELIYGNIESCDTDLK